MTRVKCPCGRILYSDVQRCPSCGRGPEAFTATTEEIPAPMTARDRAVERLAKAIRATQDGVLPRPEHIPGFVDGADSDDVEPYDVEATDALMREIGLVAVDPALAEAVERAQAAWEEPWPQGAGPGGDYGTKVLDDMSKANSDLAIAVVAQLRGGS